jgi:hypothetical protein
VSVRRFTLYVNYQDIFSPKSGIYFLLSAIRDILQSRFSLNFNACNLWPDVCMKFGMDDKENKEKMREVVSILMESALYFDFPLEERKRIVLRLIEQLGWA